MPLKVSPNDPNHAKLQEDVVKFLTDKGFWITEDTHHTTMPSPLVHRLSEINTPTSLYIRTRADLVAVHHSLNLVIQVEVKTRCGKSPNVAIEAIPLMFHREMSSVAVDTLYIYRDPIDPWEFGFWVKEMPTPDALFVPKKWNHRMYQYVTALSRSRFPVVKIVESDVEGSGDPYYLWKRDWLKDQVDWRVLIDERIEQERNRWI